MRRLLLRVLLCLVLAGLLAAPGTLITIVTPPAHGWWPTPAERYLGWAAMTAMYTAGLLGATLLAGAALRAVRKTPAGCCAHCGNGLAGCRAGPAPSAGGEGPRTPRRET